MNILDNAPPPEFGRITFAEPLPPYTAWLGMAALMGGVLLAIGVTLALVKLWERRAQAVDKIVTGLAAGVRAKRQIAEKRRSFWQRVMDRANQG
jgi:hypothetical protein